MHYADFLAILLKHPWADLGKISSRENCPNLSRIVKAPWRHDGMTAWRHDGIWAFTAKFCLVTPWYYTIEKWGNIYFLNCSQNSGQGSLKDYKIRVGRRMRRKKIIHDIHVSYDGRTRHWKAGYELNLKAVIPSVLSTLRLRVYLRLFKKLARRFHKEQCLY
jgi:hypothetical protein